MTASTEDKAAASIGKNIYYYIHRYEKNGNKAPLKPGKYTMICDTYECERRPHIGESGEAYMNYAVQTGKPVNTKKETHYVE